MSNNLIKENWLKVIFGIIIIIFVSYLIFYLPKAKQTGMLNQQNCSQQADAVFKAYMIKMGDYEREYNSNHYSYENHYNSQINGCFVLITNNTENDYSSVLYNAYENKELGGVYTAMNIAGLCGLHIGNSYKECQSVRKEGMATIAEGEFYDLGKFYMEN